jgi:lactate permease
VWQPADPLIGERTGAGRPAIAGAATADTRHEVEVRRRDDDYKDTTRDKWEAFAPYLIIIAIFSIAQIGFIKTFLADLTQSFDWPGLDILTTKGEAPTSQTYNFNWANAAGTLLLVSGLLTMLVLRVSPGRALRVFGKTLNQLKLATITVMSVLALAYVMNQSAQTLTIGNWIAGAGGVLAFFSSIIGWLGVAVTGSDTSSNSLFGVLQQQAATKAGIDPILLTAGNSSGGVLGKMVSPQNLAIGAAAVGLAGREGDLFRRVLGWSLIMLLFMCILVYLQSTSVLGWMVP